MSEIDLLRAEAKLSLGSGDPGTASSEIRRLAVNHLPQNRPFSRNCLILQMLVCTE